MGLNRQCLYKDRIPKGTDSRMYKERCVRMRIEFRFFFLVERCTEGIRFIEGKTLFFCFC